MKSGYCTRTWNGRDDGAREMNPHQPHHRPFVTQRRWCSVYGGLERNSLLRAPSGEPSSAFRQAPLPARPAEAALGRQHPGSVRSGHVTLPQASARPYGSLMARQNLGQEVLAHPPRSPDLAPSDFHLSWSLQNAFNGKISLSWKTVKGTWNSSFGSKR